MNIKTFKHFIEVIYHLMLRYFPQTWKWISRYPTTSRLPDMHWKEQFHLPGRWAISAECKMCNLQVLQLSFWVFPFNRFFWSVQCINFRCWWYGFRSLGNILGVLESWFCFSFILFIFTIFFYKASILLRLC